MSTGGFAHKLAAKGGGAESFTIRAAAALTTSYVASSSFDLENADQLDLQVAFTLGSSTGCRLKVEFSMDDSNWFQESYAVLEAGDLKHALMTRLISASASMVISIPVAADYVRVSALAVTSGTGTSLAITGVRANL